MNFIKDLFNLFFPEVCATCNKTLSKNEYLLCVACRFELPLADVHDLENNFVEATFHGRVQLEFATSLLLYKRKNATQKLIQELKYRGREDIGAFLGKWLGADLAACERLPKIDLVIPVPISTRKLKKRGFNQTHKFGEEIAKHIDADFNPNILESITSKQTQTFKSRFERWYNVKDIFRANSLTTLEEKSILLVDDVITTGATLEACAEEFSKVKGIKISFATMAFTS